MSVRVTTAVWENSRHSGGALLVMLALADQSNDQGESWPSIPTIAHKARLSPRQVMGLIPFLERSGELGVDRNNTHGGRGHTNHYYIRVQNLHRSPPRPSGNSEDTSPFPADDGPNSAMSSPFPANSEETSSLPGKGGAETVKFSPETVKSGAETVKSGPVNSEISDRNSEAGFTRTVLTELIEPSIEPSEPVARGRAREGFFLGDDLDEDWYPGTMGQCSNCGRDTILSRQSLCKACFGALRTRARAPAPPGVVEPEPKVASA